MRVEGEITLEKSKEVVKIEEKSVKKEKKRVFKHLDLDLENIRPYPRGLLAE